MCLYARRSRRLQDSGLHLPCSVGTPEKSLSLYDGRSVYLAMEIAEYAHRNQKRENGEDYVNHPMRCYQKYQKLVGIEVNDPFCIDSELMFKYGIPFDGVQEVCILQPLRLQR